jgi:hypothetical protein
MNVEQMVEKELAGNIFCLISMLKYFFFSPKASIRNPRFSFIIFSLSFPPFSYYSFLLDLLINYLRLLLVSLFSISSFSSPFPLLSSQPFIFSSAYSSSLSFYAITFNLLLFFGNIKWASEFTMLCLCVPPINIQMPETIFVTLLMYELVSRHMSP